MGGLWSEVGQSSYYVSCGKNALYIISQYTATRATVEETKMEFSQDNAYSYCMLCALIFSILYPFPSPLSLSLLFHLPGSLLFLYSFFPLVSSAKLISRPTSGASFTVVQVWGRIKGLYQRPAKAPHTPTLLFHSLHNHKFPSPAFPSPPFLKQANKQTISLVSRITGFISQAFWIIIKITWGPVDVTEPQASPRRVCSGRSRLGLVISVCNRYN